MFLSLDTDSVTCLLQVTPGLTLPYPPSKDSPKAASDFILGFGFSPVNDRPRAFLNTLCTASDWKSWWFLLRPRREREEGRQLSECHR